MSINFNEYLCVSVMLFCLCLGFILKDTIKVLNNNLIPAILMVVGAIAYCFMSGQFSVNSMVIGMISGFASTGLHQNFRKFAEGVGILVKNNPNINNKNDKKEDK